MSENIDLDKNHNPWVGICADDNELARRHLFVTAFQNAANLRNAEVRQACAECPVQAECLDTGINEVKTSLDVTGVWGGMKSDDIQELLNKPKELNIVRRGLLIQQLAIRNRRRKQD